MIGTKTNNKQRIQFARVDSFQRQAQIESARKLIFDGGLSITNKRVEDFLRPTSLVPTRVSDLLILFVHYS
jgi:hypothetical protein